MATKINQKEYLKKYLSSDKNTDKKKKKKKNKQVVDKTNLRIIDDDIDISKLQKISEEDLEVYAIGEDAPQIVGVFDERPAELIAKEDYKNSEKWKMLAAVDGTLTINNFGQDGKMKSSNRNSKRDVTSPASKWGARVKVERSPDASPPRRRRDSDASPPRRTKLPNTAAPSRRFRSPNASPVRKIHSPNEFSSKKRRSPDASPLRKRRSPDPSPPRRHRNQNISPPRRRDASPSRRHPINSPKANRNHRHDSHASPPRRRHESDASPRRRRNSADRTPRRKRRSPDKLDQSRNVSPPRRIKVERSLTPSATKRKKMSRWSRDRSIAPPEAATSSKMIKTLDGKSAGLQDAKSLRQESNKFRKREEELFEGMSSDMSGRNAEAVMRDRRTGRVRDFDAEAEKEDEKIRKELERKAVYDHWGKGVKQVEDYQTRLQDAAHEISKPLARYSDDQDLDNLLKQQDRDGDPMLEYLRSKEQTKEAGKPCKPIYRGMYPENRFGIRPGYRWDGVDRSNGFEVRWFDVQSQKKAGEEEAYKYSTEDM